MKETLPMAELKRRVTAELDRALGGKGTVTDVAIEVDGGNGWRVTEVDSDAEPEFLTRAAESVLPKLHAALALEPPVAPQV
jgi:hypothetical protein